MIYVQTASVRSFENCLSSLRHKLLPTDCPTDHLMTPTDPVFIRWGTGGKQLQGKASNYDNKVVQRDKKPYLLTVINTSSFH